MCQRPKVNTLHYMPKEEAGGVSPSTDSSGSMPTSPQSIVQSNVSVAVSSPAASDHPAISRDDSMEEAGYFDLGLSKIENHESLQM